VHTIHHLDRARIEREERATLWPIDELPLDAGQAVAVGEMRKLMELARRIASTNVSVLITGESGTGKEILARAVHAFSARAAKPFVAMNCTAIPHDMLESQMFGHRRGAFTGADRDHLGVIRAARDGTLFLDEIGEMGLDLQPKILRFLESGEISPLGEPEPLTVNVRIVAATNANLEDLVRDGRFREDLFYRLNVVPFFVPPLRERKQDIPLLTREFLAEFGRQYGRPRMEISDEALELLQQYHWPGNVRELKNVIERVLILNPRTLRIERTQLPPLTHKSSSRSTQDFSTLQQARDAYERDYILKKIEEARNNVSRAAELLGLERSHLYRKMKTLGITVRE
jgi:two-component system, NtrC family, nitrogen regulation response regulator NtrX